MYGGLDRETPIKDYGEKMVFRAQVMSDLHLEFRNLLLEAVSPKPDVLILAGDIHVGTRAAEWACQISKLDDIDTVIVGGNHELYGKLRLDRWAEEFRAVVAREGAKVHVLDNSSAEINGVRILGCILWTDYNLFGFQDRSMRDAKRGLSDFMRIRKSDGHLATPGDFLAEHNTSVAWLREELAKPFDGETIVVTHHGPSAKSVHEVYRTDPLSPAFCSNLDDLVGASGASLWVHGHVHTSFDYQIGGTRVVANPRGYTKTDDLNPQFRPDLVIEIDQALKAKVDH
jgi:Icc-related predicted phosphoesterase